MFGKNIISSFFTPKRPVQMNWKEGSYKVQEAFKVKNEKLGTINVKVDSEFDKLSDIIRVKINLLKKGQEKPIAYESLQFTEKNKNVFASYMEVDSKFRFDDKDTGKTRLGELLRLLSIAQFAENKIPSVSLFSKTDAIYFHSKYKFLPIITSEHSSNVLCAISSEKSPQLSQFVKEAKELRETFWSSGASDGNNAWWEAVNDLTARYLKRVIDSKLPPEEHSLKTCIDMTLTKERLIENKDFFNKKFDFHGIDFQV